MRKLALSGNTQNQTLAKIVYIFLLFQLALSITVTSLNENEVTDIMILQKGRKQREFDYFVLALQWPGTVCNATRHCCSTNACCRRSGSPAEFTLHGLWPDYNDGSWPSCCTRSRFDEKEIQSLLHPLNQYWPSLSCGSPSTCHGTKGSFWAHEWEKHGTCSYPVVHDEYNYFLMTLNIYFKYNVTRVLNDAGYVPSNTEKYPLGGVISAIENAFHQTPLLVCSRGAIEELRLCFYKDLKPRDCAQTDSQNALISSKISCLSYVSLPVYETGGRILKGIISSDSSIQGNQRVRTSMIMKMKKQWILIRKARGQTMKITIVE